MNRDDVLRLASEAGWDVPSEWDATDGFLMRLERFAALVAAYEREECARVCDDLAKNDSTTNYYLIAARTIRAREGNNEPT